MTHLTLDQRLKLEVVALRKQRLDDERRAKEAAIRSAMAEATTAWRIEFENAVIDAHLAGVPNAQIARAIGTTNPKPIREVIRRAASEKRAAQDGRYQRGDGSDRLVVRLDDGDLARACELTGWTVSEAIASGVDEATFRVTDAGTLIAVTPSFDREAGKLHPVVAHVRRSGPSEAMAWWRATR